MVDGYNLTERATRRTAEAVRKVLGAGVDLTGGPGRRARGLPYQQRWYRIVANAGGGEYTVRMQEWDADAGELADMSDPDHPEYETDQTAFDSHGRAHGVAGRIVEGWMIYADGEWVTIIDAGDIIMFGKPTVAYESGATITLDPCDAGGTDNGVANVTVNAGWTLPANTNIPTTAIIPFVQAGANYYVIGQPREVITNIQYDTTAHKLQKKVRYDFGAFATTESSAWVDITTAVDCTA